jgi:hypothetical protein
VKKRCFVISPIGPEGSEVREHADDVLDFIITPALEECGIEPVRSDRLAEPGKITDQMFRELLDDDLCIAVLTFHNPNVFYELAIAQAAARPLIVLLQKGEALPFDVADLRCVQYDLKPRPLTEGTYAKEIVAHIRSLEAAGWKVSVPFGAVSPLGGRPTNEPFRFFAKSMDYGTSDTWLHLLRTTEKVFEVMGITLGSWRRTQGFADTLKEKAAKGCKVRILLVHPDNPMLRELVNTQIPEVDYDRVVRDTDGMFRFFSKIAEESPNVAVRRLTRGAIHCQLTRTDYSAAYIPYFYLERTQFTPLWYCANESPLYDLVTREFEALWRANEAQ